MTQAATIHTIADASAALRSGQVTSVELVEHAAQVADALDERLGMFLKRFTDTALQAAALVDEKLAQGQTLGALAGIPIGIKDNISTFEAATTAQSLVLDPAWSNGDAEVVHRLRNSGALIMGKLTTMEFAVGPPDSDKPFPLMHNPWNLDHWPGGSSSGSASSVAVGAVLGALGSDTGGSIRVPSAYCGITGLKPTFGLVPKSGAVPAGYTLDHIGPMARSARDCALLLSAVAGCHYADPTAVDVAVADYAGALTGDLGGVRIGVDRFASTVAEFADPAFPAAFDAAIGVLLSHGADVVEIELPLREEMTTACMVIAACEGAAYHLPDLQNRWEDYFAGTRAMLAAGAFYSGFDYVQAQRVRRVGQRRLAETFAGVDVIASPTSCAGAPSLAEMRTVLTGIRTGSGPVLTPYWDTAGNPALSAPIGFTDAGLPLGLQIAGRPFDEATVLKVADAYQRVTDWHLRVPPLAAELTPRA